MASDLPERMVKVSSNDSELKLYDGRMLAQNGWFVLRSILPKGKTGKVVTWTVEPNAIDHWVREPNVGFSQVGYVPEQPKVAVIELDCNDKVQTSASLVRIMDDGTEREAFRGDVKTWGKFYGNNRADFSAIPGNVAPGVLFRKPDHFENFDDWPFLWGQNEGTIAGNTQYIIFGSAFKNQVKNTK